MKNSTLKNSTAIIWMLLLLFSLTTIARNTGEQVSIQAPHHENFDSQSGPDLPLGWHKIVDNPTHEGALVRVISTNNPYSAPNHVRMLSDTNTEAQVILITPLVNNFENLRIRFFAKSNLSSSVPDLILGTMTNPLDAATFIPFDTIKGITELNNQYQRYISEFNQTHTTPAHIAFRHGGALATTRSIFIDDFVLEQVPTAPVLKVTPDSYDYEKVIPGTSKAASFTISNTGIGTLTVNPEQITITGVDSQSFVLTNLTTPANLEPFETATIQVSFAPTQVGNHEATLNVADMQIPLAGTGFDPTITQVPHLEEFGELDPPDIALGWSKIVQTTSTGGIETLSTSGPISPPYHVRFQNSIDADAQLILISPVIDMDLSQLRTRFYSKALLGDDNAIEVGVITNPSNISTYTPLATFPVTTTYQEFIFSFAEYEGTATHIAFRAALPALIRSIFIDNFLLEEIPGEPIFNVSPQAKDFNQIQLGTGSDPQEFTITNHGEGLMIFSPEDIHIQGEHASEFYLENITETVELAGGESAVISVTFMPLTEGPKEADLMIGENSVPLSGEGIEATITQFPYVEDFSGYESGTIPFGWIRDKSNWRIASTDNAGGEAPELRMLWNPAFSGKSMITSPLINTTGFDEMKLSLDHMLDNFGSPGSYTIKIVTIIDETQHLVHEWVDPSNIPAEEFWTILTQEQHGIGAENLRLGFVFDGVSQNMNNWNIDNLLLEEVPEFAEVSFVVMEDSFAELPVEGALITFNSYIDDLTTNEEGLASAALPDGTFLATVSAQNYQETQISFTVQGEDISVEIRMTDIIHAPYNLQAVLVDDNLGNVMLSWQHENPTREFTGFNVFLNSLDNPVESEITENEHLFTRLESGTYTAGVQAVYSTGLSSVSVIEFEVEIINIPTVEVPWVENFSGIPTGEIPQGWTATTENWMVVNTSGAGGQAPEMQFNWSPPLNGISYLKSPFINTSNYDTLQLSFRNYLDVFNDPADFSIKVVAIVANQEYLIHEWEDTGSIPPNLFSTLLNATDHGVGSDSLQIAWVFSGDSEDINWWNFDNVSVTVPSEQDLYSLTFIIHDQEGESLTEAVITLNGTTYNPGHYIFNDLEEGIYSYTISKDGFHNAEGETAIAGSDVTETIVMLTDNTNVINPGEQASLSIFPNPASSHITVSANQQINEVRIIDLSGKVIYKEYPGSNSASIDISRYRQGIYLIQVFTPQGTKTQRLQISG